MKRRQVAVASCPCGSGHTLETCCGPYLNGSALPQDAEALMRSRYTAYTQGNAAYLLATWHPDTRPEDLDLGQAPIPQWLALEVKRHTPIDATHAEVEFTARYKIGGRAHRMWECSQFEQLDGCWYYLNGEIHDPSERTPR